MATNRDAARAGRRDGRAGPHLREDRGEARDVFRQVDLSRMGSKI